MAYRQIDIDELLAALNERRGKQAESEGDACSISVVDGKVVVSCPDDDSADEIANALRAKPEVVVRVGRIRVVETNTMHAVRV